MVKCRVLAHDPAHKGLKLSLVSKKKAAAAAAAEAAEGGQAEPGSAPAEAEAAAPAAKKPAAAAEGEEGGDALGGVQAGDLVAATVKALHSKEVCVLLAVLGHNQCSRAGCLCCGSKW